jgi:opacity protein-like surface antigen
MKQIYQLTLSLCLLVLLSGTALAQHAGPYIGAFAGGDNVRDAKGTDDLGTFTLKFDQAPALQWSAVLGWDFERGNPVGEGRIELEYTRRSNQLEQVKFAEGDAKGGGEMKADALLINFFGVAHDNSRFSPYVGAGVGAVRLEAANLTVNGYPMSNDSVVSFVYQLGAGLDIALNNHLNLDLGYRYLNSPRPRFTEANGRKFKMEYASHSALLGLRVGF